MKALNNYVKKMRVYSSYLDQSFDRKDKKRLKPITRLRKNMEEIEKEQSGDIKQRVQDWYCDIDRGYSR
jgi:hypothetical protein